MDSGPQEPGLVRPAAACTPARRFRGVPSSDLPLGMVVKSQVSRHTSLSLSLSLTLTDLMNAENCLAGFQFGDRAVCVYVIVKLNLHARRVTGLKLNSSTISDLPECCLCVCSSAQFQPSVCTPTSPRTATPKRWPTVCSGSPLTVEGRCWACRAAAPCCGSPAPRQPSAPASAWRTKTCWATASRCPSLRTARRRKRSAGPRPPPLRSCLWRSHAHPGALRASRSCHAPERPYSHASSCSPVMRPLPQVSCVPASARLLPVILQSHACSSHCAAACAARLPPFAAETHLPLSSSVSPSHSCISPHWESAV